MEAGQEVLYENTGYSKYFATSFPTDISGYESWEDFEKTDFQEFQEDRGTMRINRVYRQLAVCPSFYWEGNEDADALYLKNQRQWVSRYLKENLGGNLDIYRNIAFLTLDGDDCYGAVHPRDAMLPEAVLLVCDKIRDRLAAGEWKKQENECISVTKKEFADLVSECRNTWNGAWSKEFREMDESRLQDTILGYMKNWLMLRCEGETVIILPSVGRASGYYPEDFKGGAGE